MRFTLRGLLAAVLVFSVVVILGARNYRRVQDEQTAIAALEKAGAHVVHVEPSGWLAACLRSPCQATSVSYTGAPTFTRPDPSAPCILEMAARCPGLETLMVCGADMSETDVFRLRLLPRLRSVDLQNCRLDAPATAAVFQLDHVTSLSLWGADLRIQPQADAKVNRRLRELDLYFTAVDDTNVLTLANRLPALHTLLLRSTSVTERVIPHLDRFPHLQVLDLGRTGISGQGFARGVKMSTLEVLLLSDSADLEENDHYGRALEYDRRVIEPEAVVPVVDLDDFVSLPALRKLDLSGRKILAADAGRRWDRLEWLALSGSSLDDAALGKIGDAPRLRELGIADTAVTDAGLAKLPALFPSLRSLDLRGTMISLDGLRTLAALPDLADVFVSADMLECSNESLCAVFRATSVVRVYVYDDESTTVECDKNFVEGKLNIIRDLEPVVINYPAYWD